MSEDSDVDELVDTPMIKVENIEIEDDQGWMWLFHFFVLFLFHNKDSAHFIKNNEE